MVNIQIPKMLLPGFQSLANLSNNQVNEIGLFLQTVPIGTGNGTFRELFEEKFPDVSNPVIPFTIFSLASFQTSELKDLNPDELADLLLKSYIEQTHDESPIVKDSLKSNLLVVFENLNNILVSYKVFSLLSENGKIFTGSHIISDIRLIFKDKINNKDRNALIIHKLKVITEESNEKKEYFFSLDTSDLKKLKEQIERAEEKDKLIREQYSDVMSFITITD